MKWKVEWLQRYTLDAATRGWIIISGGTAVRLIIGFFTGIILARVFGPQEFGKYALLGAVSSIAGVVTDLGLSETAVKRIAAVLKTNPQDALKEAQYFFWLRFGIAVGGIFLGIGFILLSEQLFQIYDDVGFLILALFSVGTATLSGSINTMLQALGRFTQLSAVLVASSTLTLIAIMGLAKFGQLTILTGLLVGITVPIAGFLIAYMLLPAQWRGRDGALHYPGTENLKSIAKPYFQYSRWLWVSSIFKVLMTYLDLFLVNRWMEDTQLGIYALALNLASKAEFVNHSLYTVLIPTAAALSDKDAVRSYLRRSFKRSIVIGVGLLVIAPFAAWLIPRVYGIEYAAAVPLFLAMLVIVFFDIVTLPAVMLIYTYDRPQFTAVSGAVQVAILLLCGAWLVPIYGAWGMIAARFLAKFVGTGYVLLNLNRHYHQLPTPE